MTKFVVVEGPDGSGKTTLINNLVAHYKSSGTRVMQTRDPGATPIATEIREVLLKLRSSEQIAPIAELMLFNASRIQLQQMVRNAMKSDEYDLIICDRYVFSTLAYQGSRGIPEKLINDLHTLGFSNEDNNKDIIWPKTLMLSGSFDVFQERIKLRGGLDRFDSETVDYQKAVHARYSEIAKTYHNVMSIVADGSADATLEAAISAIGHLPTTPCHCAM